MAVGYVRQQLDEKIPTFKLLAEWDTLKSTKCAYMLIHDDVPDISIVDGALFLPPIPPLQPGQPTLQTTKILI